MEKAAADKIFRENREAKMQAVKEAKIAAEKAAYESINRITSYNVCYTKLLRKNSMCKIK